MFFKLVDALGLTFSCSKELNGVIDKKLPNGLPKFVREEVELNGDKYEFYHCDIIQCIRALYGDPELANFLVHTPEKWYTGPDKKVQIYSEMHTGRWWWTCQVSSPLVSCSHVLDVKTYRKNLRRNYQMSLLSPFSFLLTKRGWSNLEQRLHILCI